MHITGDILKACLNHAASCGKPANTDAWLHLKRFRSADSARLRWLTVDEGVPLIFVAEDVQRCLRGGVITEGPYVPVDSRTSAWRCNVEGIINGDRLRVVVELPKEPPDLLVVTVIDLGR